MSRTIGIECKINLGGYESLGLSYGGEIAGPEDAKAFLEEFDAVLQLLGHEKDAKSKVDSYRARVLGKGPGAKVQQATLGPAARPETLSPSPPGPVNTARTMDLPGCSPHASGREIEQAITPPNDKPDAAPAPVQNGNGHSDLSCETAAEKIRKQQANKTAKAELAKFNAKGAEEIARACGQRTDEPPVIRGEYECHDCGKGISADQKEKTIGVKGIPQCAECFGACMLCGASTTKGEREFSKKMTPGILLCKKCIKKANDDPSLLEAAKNGWKVTKGAKT